MGKSKDTAANEAVADTGADITEPVSTATKETAAPKTAASTEVQDEPVKHVRKQFNCTFEDGLKEFVSATTRSMDYARFCAEKAMLHFKEHGDTSQLQKLMDAMELHGKNFVRIQAYRAWMVYHMPIRAEGGKLLKDKTREWVETLVQEALETPFWEFAPEPPIKPFTYTDVVKKLQQDLKNFHNEDKYAPATPDVLEKLKKIETFVMGL